MTQVLTVYRIDLSILAIAFEDGVPQGVAWPEQPAGTLVASVRTLVLIRNPQSDYDEWTAAQEHLLDFVAHSPTLPTGERVVHQSYVYTPGADGQVVDLDERLVAIQAYGYQLALGELDLSGPGANSMHLGVSAFLLAPGLYSEPDGDGTQQKTPTTEEFQSAVNKVVEHFVNRRKLSKTYRRTTL